jgi:hypothetical protein
MLDGVSLAWGITECLHDHVGCRTLFATHYHELAQLAERLPGLRNCNALVHEAADGIVFLHKIAPGSADKSYGIHLARLQEAVNTQHIHPRLDGQRPAQHRRGLRLQKLPAGFVVPTERLPLAEGRVTFIRRVSVVGTVTLLSQSFGVGKKHRGLYVRLVVDTGCGWLTAYLNGCVLKRWPYKLLND